MEIPTKEDSNRIEKKLDQILLLMSMNLNKDGAEPVDAKDVAKRVGIDPRSIYKFDYRHYLPNYGVSEFETGKKRWSLETYMNWESIPEEKRRSDWLNMPAREREKIVLKKRRQIPA